MNLSETYDYVFKDLADPRVYEWPFMSNPTSLLGMIGVYLYSVYVYLPEKMNSRKPFELRHVLAAYNILQVVACFLLMFRMVTSGWTTHYTFGCQLVDYSNDQMELRMAGCVWWTMILKMIEMIETIFFVLRKKFNQVTLLHVYHHISTLSIAWLATKYFAGGMITFSIIINCYIHILMYTYYLLASLGTAFQVKLAKWKSKLTMMQMIQFLLIIVHTAQAFSPSCKYPKIFAYIGMPDILILFYMFASFYKKSYTKVSIS